MNTMPWANGPASGGSTISLGAGWFSIGTRVLWAEGPVAVSSASAAVSGLMAGSLSQGLEAGAKIFHQRLRLLPGGEVRAFGVLLVVQQAGIRLLGPFPRA